MASAVEAVAPGAGAGQAPPAAAAPPPPQDAVGVQAGTVVGKKKRKPKGVAARGPTALPKKCGTGFEEYYAEPPLTRGEYEEEMGLYHAALSFDERIETCLQRYRARRRFDNERAALFNRYLMVGGIDCTPRQFTGGTGDDAAGTSADDRRARAATDVVPHAASTASKFYASDNDHLWTVDFAGVVSGFLSVSLRSVGNCRASLMALGVDVVDNFLRYLQIHDVCPEHDDSIKQARAVCVRARRELPSCLLAPPRMPGQFNLACAQLFCHAPEHLAFHDGLDPRDRVVAPAVDAATVFRETVALQSHIIGPKALALARDGAALDAIHIVATKVVDLEITGLVFPSDRLRQRYASANERIQGRPAAAGRVAEEAEPGDAAAAGLCPAGVVVARHYCIEEGIANQPRPTPAELAARGRAAFLLDAAAMDVLCVGMKLRVVMHELSCDLNFVSAVRDVLPSFYTFLPQELMMDWKEPRPNEREAPSDENPEAEDEAEQRQLGDDKA